MATLSNCNIRFKSLLLSFQFIALNRIDYSIKFIKEQLGYCLYFHIQINHTLFFFIRVATRSGKVRKHWGLKKQSGKVRKLDKV